MAPQGFQGNLIFVNHYYRRQVKLVLGAFQLSRTVLDKYPDMLSAHLIGRLLPEINNHWHIRNLILQCDKEGFEHNCLVPMKYYLNSPGMHTYIKYSFFGDFVDSSLILFRWTFEILPGRP